MALSSVLATNRVYWMQFIFAGQAYNMQYKFTVAQGASVEIEIITPADFLIHITNKYASTSSDEIDIELIEDPATVTDGTTAIPSFNMDRRSAKTSALQIYSDPTAITGGTVIESLYLPGFGGLLPTLSNGQVGQGLSERVLRPSTKYIFRATNNGTASATIQYNWFWYQSSN